MNLKIVKEKLAALKSRGFFHILIGSILVKIIAFISSIAVIRIISKEEYGLLSYVDNIYSYINLFSGLGLSTAILKYCSTLKTKEYNSYFFSIALKYGTLFQGILSGIVILICIKDGLLFPKAFFLLISLLFYPLLTQILATFQSYIRAQLNNNLFAKIGIVQAGLVFILSILFTLDLGVIGIVYARYIAIVIVLVMCFKFIHSIGLRYSTNRIDVIGEKEKRDFWKLSISLMLANFFSMVMPLNEMFMINTFLKDELMTANYKVAVLIPSQMMFLASSILIYVFPRIAQMDSNKILKYTLKIEILLFILIFIAGIIGFGLTPLVVKLVYGDKYIDAIGLSKTYWIVYAINAGFRMLPMNILPAVGSTYFNSVFSILTCIFHTIILYFLIPLYGIYGAAYTLLIVYFLSGIGYWIYFIYKYRRSSLFVE